MPLQGAVRWFLYAVIVTAYALACEKGWFGRNCQYRCRCQANNCDSVEGLCLDGSKCLSGWFGPACQFADLANRDTVTNYAFSPLSTIVDGNEDTCLGPFTKEVSLRWTIPYQITWMRVHVQDSYLLNRFSVMFKSSWNKQFPCHNFRTTKVSEKAVDIYCDLNATVTQLTLSWEGKSHVCSLYVSGGRNVALKQNTTQSSTDQRTYKTSASTNAVDGDTTNDNVYGNCAQTGSGDLSPKWSVTLSRNFTVNRYVLYHRIDSRYFLRRTYWFTLKGLDAAGSEVFIDRGTGLTKQNSYRITTGTHTQPVAAVSIQSSGSFQRYSAAPSVISLCEVEVYGESICEHGQYGRDCEHKCNCIDKDEQCSVSTGGCYSGCSIGFTGEGCSQSCLPGRFGQDCNSTCSQLCLANSDDISVCDHINGTCLLGCQIGYEGPWCNTTCASGTYGQGCSSTCSESCASDSNMVPSCHHLHGVCLQGCQPGYKGLMCSEPCTAGLFGHNCSSACPRFCLTNNRDINICDHTNGECLLGCQSGYDGPWCNMTCTAGSYGLLCRSRCPEFCSVGSDNTPLCHHIHGTCELGCRVGYTGSTCDKMCEPGLYGQDCRSRCSTFCATDGSGVHFCHHITGVCLRGCQTGYDGPWCNKTCDNGTHGKDCNSPCPQFCDVRNIDEPVCHHVDGMCLQGCQAGHKGLECNETCESGTYGLDCGFQCSESCQVMDSRKPVCHYTNGTCLYGCQRGYTGPTCTEECVAGKFGTACQFNCSIHCVNVDELGPTCHHVNGSCLYGCLQGYNGHNCTRPSSKGSSHALGAVWVTAVFLVLAVVVVAGTVMWWRRRQIKSQIFNVSMHVKIRRMSTNSTENIIKTDLPSPDTACLSE